MSRKSKLQRLAEIEGFDDVMDLYENAITDAAVPGICMKSGCDYTCEVEPDQREGWCEECGTNTVVSCLVLGGIV